MNMGGVLFYNVTPLCVYFYELWSGQEAKVGFVWVSWYPFDKHKPINHVFVYLFEMFAGEFSDTYMPRYFSRLSPCGVGRHNKTPYASIGKYLACSIHIYYSCHTCSSNHTLTSNYAVYVEYWCMENLFFVLLWLIYFIFAYLYFH